MTIISFAHNLVFLKTAKTAGTSIEIDLSQRVEDDAIVTPIFPEVAGHRPRGWQGADGKARFWNHMPGLKVREEIGPDRWNGMRRFCVEREPVSKCISHFHMLRNSPDHNPGYDLTWERYCDEARFPVNLPTYTERRDGKMHLMVTDVLRYDRLAHELPALLAEQGIEDFRLTARAKSEYSRNAAVRPQDVTPAQRKRIYDAFAPVIAVTGIDWQEGG